MSYEIFHSIHSDVLSNYVHEEMFYTPHIICNILLFWVVQIAQYLVFMQWMLIRHSSEFPLSFTRRLSINHKNVDDLNIVNTEVICLFN